jgi:predicted TIM-barrel fold metal-dependent hydrolase
MQPIAAVDLLFQPADGICSSPDAALAAMDAAGIAVAFVAPCTKLTCERQWACVDTRIEDVARFLRASIRFAGLCGYNPFDSADSLREMEATRTLGFRGAYVHLDSFGIPLDDARFYPLFATASQLALPVLLQSSGPEPGAARALRRIGRDFPELALAFSHPAPAFEMFELLSEFDRLAFVLDTGALASLVRDRPSLFDNDLHAARCLWGSNGALLPATLSDAQSLPLSPALLRAILRDNALRFFATTPPPRLPRALDDSNTLAER